MKFHKMALGLAAMLALAGCTAATGSSSLQREVDTLKMEVADIKDGGRHVRSGRSGSASGDVYVEVGQLRTDVQRLTESVETAAMGGMTLRQQLEYISARLDRLEKRAGLKPLDTNVVAVPPPTPVVTAPGPAPVDQTPFGGQTAAEPTPATGPYEEGRALFEQKHYREAGEKFRAYLSAQPKGSNASAAQFYVGETLYFQQQYEEAILEYQKVISDFPKSDQVPNSLLKQGLSFQAIGDRDGAKMLYQKVVRDHPKSYAAGVAKTRLQTL